MCDRDNCARYENHFINATFGQNSISDAVRAPSYQLLSAAGCMSDSDSNNIVKKKGRPWRKTWELHRVKNRGRIGQECCGIWHLLSPLSWDDGSHLSPARVCSPALLSAPLHIYSDGTRGDLTLSNGPCDLAVVGCCCGRQFHRPHVWVWRPYWSVCMCMCSVTLWRGCFGLLMWFV